MHHGTFLTAEDRGYAIECFYAPSAAEGTEQTTDRLVTQQFDVTELVFASLLAYQKIFQNLSSRKERKMIYSIYHRVFEVFIPQGRSGLSKDIFIFLQYFK